jgi:hypothetical protein
VDRISRVTVVGGGSVSAADWLQTVWVCLASALVLRGYVLAHRLGRETGYAQGCRDTLQAVDGGWADHDAQC